MFCQPVSRSLRSRLFMRPACRNPATGGAFSRRFTSYSGLFYDEFDTGSAWIRESARVRLPPLTGIAALVIRGETRPHPDARGIETLPPGIIAAISGRRITELRRPPTGRWELKVPDAHRRRVHQLAGLAWTCDRARILAAVSRAKQEPAAPYPHD
jgi:hypothetical protein